MPELIAAQAATARAAGCGYYDLYQATGGEGTIERWYRSSPRRAAPDLIHLTEAGARTVGMLLYRALLQGFDQHVAGRAGAGAGAGGGAMYP